MIDYGRSIITYCLVAVVFTIGKPSFLLHPSQVSISVHCCESLKSRDKILSRPDIINDILCIIALRSTARDQHEGLIVFTVCVCVCVVVGRGQPSLF